MWETFPVSWQNTHTERGIFLVRFGDLRILFLANDNNLAVSENCQILSCPVEMESTDPFFLI